MDDVSGVVLLENKSLELLQAGRVECSADYERRALAAAEALGAEDCLIVAKLSRFVANTTYKTELKQWRTTGATPQYAPCWSLLMAAATILQRRRAARRVEGAPLTPAPAPTPLVARAAPTRIPSRTLTAPAAAAGLRDRQPRGRGCGLRDAPHRPRQSAHAAGGLGG